MADGDPRRADQRTFSKILVVEDDTTWRDRVVSMLGKLMPTGETREAGNVEDARRLLHEWRPELIVLDYELPDGNAYHLLDAAHELQGYLPVVLIISAGKPRADEAFNLPARGARAYLTKPFTRDELREKFEECRQPKDLGPVLKENVGLLPLGEAVRETREIMIKEALARADGKQSIAAKLLRTSRQLLNYYYCRPQKMRKKSKKPRN